MKLDRLVSILVILLRRERVQARELAEMFEVSVRTILRDVDAINLAGIPIVTYQGVNGGIGIAEGYRLDKSILTSDDMAAVITTLKGVAGTISDSRLEILTEKLKNSLTKSQKQQLDSKTNQFAIDLSPWGGFGPLKEKVVMVRKAIDQHREMEFVYTDAEGTKSVRQVEPHTLVLKGQNWYLYGWCLSREDFRVFKLSRMKEIWICDKSFTPRDIKDMPFQWEYDWQKAGNKVDLLLEFQSEMESIVEDWFGDNVIRQPDGTLSVQTSFPENNWLYGFLLSFGPYVEVIEPLHIRKTLGEMGRKIYLKYAEKHDTE